MNYFTYFSEIEDTFVRRRGKHLLLSPLDWALIESWKERGIPLHVALRGIEHAFDSHDARKRKRSVKTLLYCQEEVEAQYAEWLESRVGSHGETVPLASDDDSSPFSRTVVSAYLARLLAELQALTLSREDELGETIIRTRNLLADLKTDYETAARPDARKLEESLTALERTLDNAIGKMITEADLEKIRASIDTQLKPYKRQMDKAAFEQTTHNLLRKQLREQFGIPRLSLFFLNA